MLINKKLERTQKRYEAAVAAYEGFVKEHNILIARTPWWAKFKFVIYIALMIVDVAVSLGLLQPLGFSFIELIATTIVTAIFILFAGHFNGVVAAKKQPSPKDSQIANISNFFVLILIAGFGVLRFMDAQLETSAAFSILSILFFCVLSGLAYYITYLASLFTYVSPELKQAEALRKQMEQTEQALIELEESQRAALHSNIDTNKNGKLPKRTNIFGRQLPTHLFLLLCCSVLAAFSSCSTEEASPPNALIWYIDPSDGLTDIQSVVPTGEEIWALAQETKASIATIAILLDDGNLQRISFDLPSLGKYAALEERRTERAIQAFVEQYNERISTVSMPTRAYRHSRIKESLLPLACYAQQQYANSHIILYTDFLEHTEKQSVYAASIQKMDRFTDAFSEALTAELECDSLDRLIFTIKPFKSKTGASNGKIHRMRQCYQHFFTQAGAAIQL